MKPNLAWTPSVVIDEDFMSSYDAAKLHVNETSARYGEQYMINLIDKKKS
jgi:hypothetical protein